jgi:hypothetical protein
MSTVGSLADELAKVGLGKGNFDELFAMIHAEVDGLKAKTHAFIDTPTEEGIDEITNGVDDIGEYGDKLCELLEDILERAKPKPKRGRKKAAASDDE